MMNELHELVRISPSLNTFKYKPYKQLYIQTNTFGHGPGSINLICTRMGLSAVNYQRYCYRFIVSPSWDLCNARQETAAHYLLGCPYYAANRIVLMSDLIDTLPPSSRDLLHLPGKRTIKVN